MNRITVKKESFYSYEDNLQIKSIFKEMLINSSISDNYGSN
jgi:hypothetical protein